MELKTKMSPYYILNLYTIPPINLPIDAITMIGILSSKKSVNEKNSKLNGSPKTPIRMNLFLFLYMIFIYNTWFKVLEIINESKSPPNEPAATINPNSVYDIPLRLAYGGKKGVIRDPHIETNMLQVEKIKKA